MKLQSLHINRGYGIDGALRGEIAFKDSNDSELKIQLDEKLSLDIVRLCAEAIIRAGQTAAKSLTSEALQVDAIEHQSDTDETS